MTRSLTRSDRILKSLLRLMGGAELLALAAVFFPVDWMKDIHQRLGLGAMSDSLLTIYLARTVSLLYAFHGWMLLFLSHEIERYRPVIRFWGLLTILAGLMLLGIDLAERVPLWWTAFEGPSVFAFGIAFTFLTREKAGDANFGSGVDRSRGACGTASCIEKPD